MDVSNLIKNRSKLLDFYRNQGYSKTYIGCVNGFINHVIAKGCDSSIHNYEDVLNKIFSKENGFSQHARCIAVRKCIISIIRDFDVMGVFPNERLHKTERAYDRLLPEFKQIIDNYNAVGCRHKILSTVKVEGDCASSFFYEIQSMGVKSPDKIQENHILSVFFKNGEPVKSYSYRYNVSAVLKANKDFATWSSCRTILSLLPKVKNKGKIFPKLRKDEDDSIKDGMRKNRLTLRDKAILSLAYYTPLRCTDISNLKFCNIDWENDIISLKIIKTEAPLRIPLLPVVGNALYDYICDTGYRSHEESIFYCSEHKIHRKKLLDAKGVRMVIYRALKKIGVRINKPQRGIRLLRHHLGSTMLEGGASTAVISAIYGHLSPESILPYFDLDDKRLQECAISMEDFPLKGG